MSEQTTIAQALTGAKTIERLAASGAQFCNLCSSKPHTHKGRAGDPYNCPEPGKIPFYSGWQEKPKSAAEAIAHLAKGGNVGLICGAHSNFIGFFDLDSDLPEFLERFPQFEHTPRVIRANAPERGKILLATDAPMPGGHKFTREGETKPFFEFLGQGNQGVIAGIHESGAEIELVNHEALIPYFPQDDLDRITREWTKLKAGAEKTLSGDLPGQPEPRASEKQGGDLLQDVLRHWDLIRIFTHWGKVTGEGIRLVGDEIKILGNGGLFVDEKTQRWNKPGEKGVGGGPIGAWQWCKTGSPDVPRGRQFWELLEEMAAAGKIPIPARVYSSPSNGRQPLDLQAAPPMPEIPPDPAGNAEQWQDPWKRRTIRDAYQKREPVEYIAGEMFALPSLNIVYGAPGTLKSFLLADLAVCTAAGVEWLPAAPWQPREAGITIRQAPVMWCDFDNGTRRTDDRFAALGRAHDFDQDNENLSYYSMPAPWLDATNKGSMGALTLRAQALGAKAIFIDNLGVVSGDAEENSGDMVQIMSYFRQVAEETGAAVILIHHQRKGNGQTGRAGDSLRGHSSIEASLDLALLIEREEQADTVTIKATKVRGADVLPFGAVFTYDNDQAGELYEAKFYGIETEDTTSGAAIEREIKAALFGTILNKTELVKAVKEILPKVGINRVRERIDRMAKQNKLIVMQGSRTEQRYTLP